jgi:hypothetical protein
MENYLESRKGLLETLKRRLSGLKKDLAHGLTWCAMISDDSMEYQTFASEGDALSYLKAEGVDIHAKYLDVAKQPALIVDEIEFVEGQIAGVKEEIEGLEP